MFLNRHDHDFYLRSVQPDNVRVVFGNINTGLKRKIVIYDWSQLLNFTIVTLTSSVHIQMPCVAKVNVEISRSEEFHFGGSYARQ